MSYLDLLSLSKTLEEAPPGYPPTVVVKVGTSSIMRERLDTEEAWANPAAAAGAGLVNDAGELALSTLALIVDTLIALKRAGFWVVLVTSGAVGVGCRRLGITNRPSHLAGKQALAAVGMGRLMHHYEELFAIANEATALVLVSRSDFGKRNKFFNIQNTLTEIFKMGVVPVVNENDTVASGDAEKFGDNDRLSALVAGMVGAKWLFLLTDVDRLYSSDPRTNVNAKPLDIVTNVNELDVSVEATGGTQWGTGGMETKLVAAKLATASGSNVVILHGRRPERILDYVLERDEKVGTLFLPSDAPVDRSSRKMWILHGLIASGHLVVDDGCSKAVANKKSLFAAGICKVVGQFYQDSAVRIYDLNGVEIGRGLVNYDSTDLQLIIGAKSDNIEQILGFPGPDEVIHRNNLVTFT